MHKTISLNVNVLDRKKMEFKWRIAFKGKQTSRSTADLRAINSTISEIVLVSSGCVGCCCNVDLFKSDQIPLWPSAIEFWRETRREIEREYGTVILRCECIVFSNKYVHCAGPTNGQFVFEQTNTHTHLRRWYPPWREVLFETFCKMYLWRFSMFHTAIAFSQTISAIRSYTPALTV